MAVCVEFKNCANSAFARSRRGGKPESLLPPPYHFIVRFAGGGFTVRKTGSCRFLFHANIHWAYYKISSAGYRVPFAFFQFDFF